MNYYMTDYVFEKHQLLVEGGSDMDLDHHEPGIWLDSPHVSFYEDHLVKLEYALSLSENNMPRITFYNDLYLSAKDGHRLATEEISIFLLLLIRETRDEGLEHLQRYDDCKDLMEMPMPSAETVLNFVSEEMNLQN